MNTILQQKLKTFQNVLEKVPEITYVGNPVLRQVTQTAEVEEAKEIGEKLGKALLQYREITGLGRGLAAPQIGINKAVFVTFVNDQLQTFINPSIIEKSKETNFYKELCISCGIMAADVERSEWITLEWTDVEGEKHTEKFDGFLARLYQHEEAHVRGIINIDEATAQGIEFATFDPLQEQLRKTNK